MTDKTKQRIQKLVPDCLFDKVVELPITLAVVLRAIQTVLRWNIVTLEIDGMGLNIGCDLENTENSYRTHVYWNLAKDSWDEQSDETRRFVGTLLGVEAQLPRKP